MDDDLMEDGPRRRPGRRGARVFKRPRFCSFCVDKVKEIDYKQPEVLSRYISEQGRIKPRRQTGSCARHQRSLAVAIKRARHLALLPFLTSD